MQPPQRQPQTQIPPQDRPESEQPFSYNLTSHTNEPGRSNTGAIVGGIVAAILILALIALLLVCLRRRRRRTEVEAEGLNPEPLPFSRPPPQMPKNSLTQFSVAADQQSEYSAPASEAAMMEINDARPLSSGPDAVFGMDVPPGYSDSDASAARSIFAMRPGSVVSSAQGSSVGLPYDDVLARFANAHREVVTPELEQSLRLAGYQPGLDPDRISREDWLRVGVGPFSLAILRDLYSEQQG
jgi:MYXO-CTERM domain-containing protein